MKKAKLNESLFFAFFIFVVGLILFTLADKYLINIFEIKNEKINYYDFISNIDNGNIETEIKIINNKLLFKLKNNFVILGNNKKSAKKTFYYLSFNKQDKDKILLTLKEKGFKLIYSSNDAKKSRSTIFDLLIVVFFVTIFILYLKLNDSIKEKYLKK